MEFDQSYHGAVDWTFPSPGATPTAANFNHNGIQTPKTATYPSQFFQDAFSTPQMPGYTTPRQFDYATMTPLQRQQLSADMMPHNYSANMNAQGEMVNGQPGMPPPPGQSGHPGPVLSPAYSHHAPVHASQPDIAMSFDTSHMQTPPPTRGSSVKKPNPQQVAFGTPSTIATRRFATPQQVIPPNQQTHSHSQAPMQFPQLQFSPNVYQFGNLGPASAPVFPQTQLLWDETTSPASYNPQQILDDPFTPASSGGVQWPPASAQQCHVQVVPFDTPVMSSFAIQAPIPRPASAAPMASTQAHASPPVMTSASVDPSLVYSSPVRPVMPSDTPQPKPRTVKPRPEIKRKDSSRTEHQRASSAESVTTSASKEVRRVNNTGPMRTQSAVSLTPVEPLSRRNSLLQPPRTGSPLKRIAKVPMGSISESKPRQRPSVVLTIDETGRARTETRRQDDSPTQSLRDRYPGLFDSDSSDEESEEDEQTPSRSASFSFVNAEMRRSKAAKLDAPVENLEGLSIPRSSSSASMKVTPSRAAIAAAAQLRRGGSLRRPTPSRTSQRRVASSATSSIDTCPMDMSFEQQQVTLQQASHEPDWFGNSLEAHNRRWSLMSQEQQQNISPTRQFPETPYQQHSRAHSYVPQQPRLVRCSCGVDNDRGLSLVQCHSCTQWSHATCIGIHPATLPTAFTCFLCTKPASSLQVSKAGTRRR